MLVMIKVQATYSGTP